MDVGKALRKYYIAWLRYLERDQRTLIQGHSGAPLFCSTVTDCPDCTLRKDWRMCDIATTRARLIREYLEKKIDDWNEAQYFRFDQVCGDPDNL